MAENFKKDVKSGMVWGVLERGGVQLCKFVASIVLYTHANRPISMEILAQLRGFAFGTAAAYSVLLILIVFGITLLGRLWGTAGTPTRHW